MTSRASLSLVRGLYLISMTHYDVLSLLFELFNLVLHLKTLNSHHCYFLLNIIIFSTCFFDKNTQICINLPNVTLSNMSHLVYITHFGETDGVTLSRLGFSCRPRIQLQQRILVRCGCASNTLYSPPSISVNNWEW